MCWQRTLLEANGKTDMSLSHLVAYLVSVVSQFMHFLNKEHLEAIYHVFKYLKGSLRKDLMFRSNNSLQIETYTNADWAGSVMDRRSISGYYSFVGGNLMTWRGKNQSIVARSSVEVEFRVAAFGIYELL